MRLIDADRIIYDIFQDDFGTKVVVIRIDDLSQIPTADAEPVRYGKWIDVRGGYLFECSKCKAQVNSKQFKSNLKYCPNCGAKMTGGIENG